jgi:hypothetical protein
VLGFPVGGDEVSITEGVVSRVEVQVRGVGYLPRAESLYQPPYVQQCLDSATRRGRGWEGRLA